MSFSVVAAKSVQVTGQGINETRAIQSAMRSAIEQELGAYVDSKTIVKNKQVIEEEISSNSEGYISGYEIISSRTENGMCIVELKVEVDPYAVNTSLMDKLRKKSLVNLNADSPRIAVLAYDSRGNEYSEVENEIFSALQRQGFSRTVDLAQINRAVRKRILSAENDPALRKTLANDFHIDYLVLSEVKILGNRNVTLSSRLLSVNTGKIIYAGNSSGSAGMFSSNQSVKFAARRAGYEISNAALSAAAKVEQHITLLITAPTFKKIGGTLTSVNNFAKNIHGVNDAFVRHMSTIIELDVDFDGTAADFAAELEHSGYKIIEVTSDFVKI